MIVLHLNGGPRDDQRVEVPREDDLFVPVLRQPSTLEPPDTPSALPMEVGRYTLRRDAFEQLVPHDLTGAVEADWDWRQWERQR